MTTVAICERRCRGSPISSCGTSSRPGSPMSSPRPTTSWRAYDVVIFSDVGYNSMIFYPGLTPPYSYPLGPDRCQMVADFVERGGGFIMVGGYLSFAGFNGIAHYHDTVIETVLPVTVSPYDDRVEVVAGFRFEIVDPAHPAVAGLDWDGAAFTLCGYNRVTLKPECSPRGALSRRPDDRHGYIRSRSHGDLRLRLRPALGRRLSPLGRLRHLLDADAALVGRGLVHCAGCRFRRGSFVF